LLAEYLPLFALLIVGYIFRRPNRRPGTSGMDFNRKNHEMARV